MVKTLNKLEELRRKLIITSRFVKLNDPNMIKLSQEFDNLVVLYYRLKQKPTPPQKEVG